MVDGLARILCMRGEVTEAPEPRSATEHHAMDSTHTKHSKERSKKIKCPKMDYNKFQPPVFDYRDGAPSTNSRTTTSNQAGHGGTPDYSPLHTQAIENDVKEIKRILRTFINRLNDKDAAGKVAKEWRIVARVLDRLFFFIYLVTIIVSLATIFPKG
jgi:hypothetical protein